MPNHSNSAPWIAQDYISGGGNITHYNNFNDKNNESI